MPKFKKGFYQIKDTPKFFELVDVSSHHYCVRWYVASNRFAKIEYVLHKNESVNYEIDIIDNDINLKWIELSHS